MIKIKQARCRRANRKVTQSPPKCQCNPSRKVLLGVCWDPKRSYFQWKGHRLSPDEPCAAPPPPHWAPVTSWGGLGAMPSAWEKEPRELSGAGRHCPSMPPARQHESLLDPMAPAQCERGKPQRQGQLWSPAL